ncbi:glycosyltransferase [Moorena sp. SIO3H5]|uniref:glycosyltransferase n=1 Tax=Moorena sp. SIO3H5 TaxID=2607834 RepID=UPI0013B8990E|nr:glycosyltransferase [Moorena sp. SIO3H5]NEO69380.1 glycosyltransferase [Moorena sp. SIO3H5]
MRLLIIQYGGDYHEAFKCLANGGAETYYAQKYSVDAVAEIGKQIGEVATLCCMTEKPYNQLLEKGVRAIGAGFNGEINVKKLIKLIEDYNPNHLIVRTPIRDVFHWAIENSVPTLALFAESIPTSKVRNKVRNYLLSQLLNNDGIQWIGSYGIDSSRVLQEIGVKSDKIIPWSFIVTETPESLPSKTLPAQAKYWQLFYIGSMIEAKGVGDILESIAQLKAHKFPIKLKIAGNDQTGFFANKAKELQIEDCVEFLGLVPNNTVVPLMRESDLVLVPSRHEFPEGFPLAITHALCARTPIIASDHPMFINKLKDGISAKIFPAGNSVALAESIQKLLSNSDLYHNLSIASYETWKSLQVPVKFADLIQRWLHDSPENKQWLIDHRLSSGRYNSTSPH